jgi:HPt (histidine-containing phosphotransfer) domain-containing protein
MSDYVNFTRSVESWGPLANVSDEDFNRVLNSSRGDDTRKHMKDLAKKQKKLKAYYVSFIKELKSDQHEIMAENEFDLLSSARQFFKGNADNIDFKETPQDKWAGGYNGYDKISYVGVR